jgi:hypothetical protein
LLRAMQSRGPGVRSNELLGAGRTSSLDLSTIGWNLLMVARAARGRNQYGNRKI